MSTIGVSFTQIRNALNKVDEFGVAACGGRGGRQQKQRDKLLWQQVVDHINAFPRTESHYCRANSKCQYLSPDLNVTLMYRMFKKKYPDSASLSLYKKVFHSLKLKFHRPKKDMCGLCDTFNRADESKRKSFEKSTTTMSRKKTNLGKLKMQ